MYLTLKDLLPLIACNSDLIITKYNLEYDEFSDRNQEPEFIQLFNSHVDCYLVLWTYPFEMFFEKFIEKCVSDKVNKNLVEATVRYTVAANEINNYLDESNYND